MGNNASHVLNDEESSVWGAFVEQEGDVRWKRTRLSSFGRL